MRLPARHCALKLQAQEAWEPLLRSLFHKLLVRQRDWQRRWVVDQGKEPDYAAALNPVNSIWLQSASFPCR